MKISQSQLRKIILKESKKIILEQDERESELREFSRGPGGPRLRKAGSRISSAASQVLAEAEGQTGSMRQTLYNVSEFIAKLGGALEGLGSLDEGDNLSMADSLPTIQELRRLKKDVAKLEK